MDVQRLLARRTLEMPPSGIRRVYELRQRLTNPIDLSLGQPDFPVPEPIKRAAADAIAADRNGYTDTRGIAPLLARIRRDLHESLGWPAPRPGPETEQDYGVIVTSGTSGALTLAALATLDPGDECVLQDPYFVLYPPLAHMTGGRAVLCDTYPDFRMTAARVEPLLTPRTRFVLCCSPSNPSGVTLTQREVNDLADLCAARNVLLISDEIYDRFHYGAGPGGEPTRAPSPCTPRPGRRPWEELLLVRGFGKTYGCTGWRMGFVAGPKALIDQMAKLHAYVYVGAPSIAQWGCLAAHDTDIDDLVRSYVRRRDMVVERLGEHCEQAPPTGAFYAFPRIPPRLGLTATQLLDRAFERSTLFVPGGAFSTRDTHFRLSYATDERTLERGLDVLSALLRG